MAKKNSFLGDLLHELGAGSGDALGELLEQVTGSNEAANMGGELLEGLLGNDDGILQGLGDVVSDLTGIGAANGKATDVAKKTGTAKSSGAKKKTVKVSEKKTEKKSTEKKAAAKKTAAKKTASSKAASSKPKSSAAKKKTV